MRIALFGPPGSGKGTQADRLARRRGLTPISTGELIRRAIASKSDLGAEARSYVQDGRLAPGSLVRRLAEQAIESLGFEDFILDGYPRTIEQAEWLDDFLERHGAPLQAMLCLRVPDELIVSRLSQRRVHRRTGETYHLVEKPPPPDVDPADVIARLDDCPEAIARRLVTYRAETLPVELHYRDLDELVEIDGTGTMNAVAERIDEALVRVQHLVV